jgi:hypothetical protein
MKTRIIITIILIAYYFFSTLFITLPNAFSENRHEFNYYDFYRFIFLLIIPIFFGIIFFYFNHKKNINNSIYVLFICFLFVVGFIGSFKKDLSYFFTDTVIPNKVKYYGRFFTTDNSVLYGDTVLDKLDPKSFEVIKDNTKEYWSPSSFYVKDKNGIYFVGNDYKENFSVVTIEGFEQNTFSLLDTEGYAMDKNAVYWRGKIIEGIDPKTFEIIKIDTFVKDKNHLFFLKYEDDAMFFVIAENVDPATFEIINFEDALFDDMAYYSKDKNHVYYLKNIFEGKKKGFFVVEEADPKTFRLNSSDTSSEYDAFDEKNKYLDGVLIGSLVL